MKVDKVDLAKQIIGGATAAAVALPLFHVFREYYSPEKFYKNQGEPLQDEEDFDDDVEFEEEYEEE